MIAPKDAALKLEAKKDRLAQGQSGEWRLTLTVAVGDLPKEIALATPGTRYMVVMVEIGDDETPKVSDAQRARILALKQSGLLPKQIDFRTFLFEFFHDYPASAADPVKHAETLIREHLNVISRAELKDNEAALSLWQNLLAEYEHWQRNR